LTYTIEISAVKKIYPLYVISPRMKQLLAFLVFILVITSCSIERRHYLPGYHVEGRWTRDEGRSARGEVRGAKCEEKSVCGREESRELNVSADELELSYTAYDSLTVSVVEEGRGILRPSSLAPRPSSLFPRPSPLEADTLKKPFKPQPQYREVDPIGKYAVYTVFVGVALQKLAGMLTWFEVAVPLSFGPAIFIPALIVALVGVGLSAYSAYRVRKYPEKYKKSEWGKAALAIFGWQVLMSALFAWLLL
jgi:hypothetical protein